MNAAAQSSAQSSAQANAQPNETGVKAARSQGLLGRLVLLAVTLLLAGQVALAWFALNGFERVLEPQLRQKVHAVGIAVADQFKYAVEDLDIPADKLVGVEGFFDQILETNPDIAYLVVLDPQSEILFARGLESDLLASMLSGMSANDADESAGGRAEIEGFIDGAFPLRIGGEVAAILHVGTSKEYVRNRLSEILYEVITVIVVSWLVTLEFLMFFMNTRVSEPMDLLNGAMADGTRGGFANRFAMRARDEIGQIALGFNRILSDLGKRYDDFRFEVREVRGAQIDERIARRIQAVLDKVSERYRFSGGATLWPRSAMQIRIPLFLFIFSEELSRSFLPLFVARLSPEGTAFSDEFLIGFPITLFMLMVAVVTPFGGGVTDRFGARRIFLAGIAFALIGYVGVFFVRGYYDFLMWRALGGIGYGLLYIAAQVWVTENTAKEQRAQGMAVFAGAIFVGAICGPAIGSIIAARIGFEATFLISAAISLISGLIVYQVLVEPQRKPSGRRTILGVREWRTLLADTRFLAITLFAAVPAKMVLTGFLFYLVPLYLNDLGNSPAAVGWVIMMYGVSTVALTSLSARYADRKKIYSTMVVLGGLLPGVGCALALFDGAIGGATASVVIAVISLGLGHALALTSQLTVAQQLADDYSDSMGQASVVAAFRLVERTGLIIGPLIAGALVAYFGYRGAMAGIGLIMIACVSVFALISNLSRAASHAHAVAAEGGEGA